MRDRRVSLFVVGLSVVALAVVFVPGAASAQSSDRPVGFGGKAAWNLSRVRGEALNDDELPIDFSSGNGFSIGGLVAFAASPNVTIQPEFLYSRKKVTADLGIEALTAIAEGEIDTDWFEIPVLAKLHGRRSEGVRPFALVGMTFSFLVNAEQSVSFMGMTETEDIKDELNSTDIGLSFGGGVDFLQSWGIFTVDARYTLGLRGLSPEDSVKQDTFSVGGGVIF